MTITTFSRAAFAASALLLGGTCQASDWGCQVLLCLADPRGPTTEGACVPPITKLWDWLAKGKVFPSCTLGGPGGSAGTYAQQGFNYYDPCPNGTHALAAGEAAVTVPPSSANIPAYAGPVTPSFGIGEGQGLMPSPDTPLPPKVCVSGAIGQMTIAAGTADDPTATFIATAYQQVVVLQPISTPAYIDVVVNGQLLRRVRY